MTKAQLEEIRAVIAECRRLEWQSRVVDDLANLLKEVERLQFELHTEQMRRRWDKLDGVCTYDQHPKFK